MNQIRNIGLRYSSTTSKIRKLNYDNLKSDTSSIINHDKTNMPVDIPNPYEKPKPKCILCDMRITPKYTNIRLLSQFVSRFTGRVYTSNITGLCKAQQENLETELKKAYKLGLMSGYYRHPRFSHDPVLADPDNPFRPHRF